MSQHLDLPDPTPDVLAALARMLDDRGVELRVTPGEELQLRDGDKRLSLADRATVRRYGEALADWIVATEQEKTDTNRHVKREYFPAEVLTEPDGPRCDRCRHAEFREVPIHDGASIRRDCARCGRTWGFPVWYGDTG